MRVMLGILAFVAMLVVVPVGAVAQSAADVARAADPSVGRVMSGRPNVQPLGTGFVVSSVPNSADLFFVTNQHVIKGGRTFLVGFLINDKVQLFEASVVTASQGRDLAVLRLRADRRVTAVPPAISVARRQIEKGEEAFAIGFPGASDIVDPSGAGLFESTFSVGAISRVFSGPINDIGPAVEIAQHTAAINPGNSGGPLVDACAKVIGVNTAFVTGSNETYAASSSNALAFFLDGANVPYRAARGPCRADAAPAPVQPAPDASPDTNSAQAPQDADGGLSVPVVVGLVITTVFVALGLVFAFPKGNSTSALEGGAAKPKGAGGSLGVTAHLPGGLVKTFKMQRSKLRRGFTIGRPGSADIGLDYAKVSRTHLRVVQDGRKIMIIDLGSTNGTTVNGKPVRPNTPVQVNSASAVVIGGVQVTFGL